MAASVFRNLGSEAKGEAKGEAEGEAKGEAMAHVVLLGDSIFDNKAYVGADEPAVIDQVRAALGEGSEATLLAIDGDVDAGVSDQLESLPADATHLESLPADATHLVLSVGGNDALGNIDLLKMPAGKISSALRIVGEAAKLFENAYDVIVRVAVSRGLPLIDRRLVFDREDDYANPIEPSAVGGAKIAERIHRVLLETDFSISCSTVYA